MPAVTSYVNFTASAWAIGSRTNTTGGAVTDVNAEEYRLAGYGPFGQGAQSAAAFQVAAGSGMVPTVGSGASKVDVAVLAGTVAGQQSYVVRLDQASISVTVPASDPASVRIDEVWLVVLDNAYDANTLGTASAPLALPVIGYRKGVAGSGAPGADTLWKAAMKLATITVPASATSIVTGNVADARTFTDFTTRHNLIDHSIALGSAIVSDLSDVHLSPISDGQVLLRSGSGWVNGRVDGLLANVSYNPGSLSTYTIGVAGSGSDVDATNLIVSFTAPPGCTSVDVELEAAVTNFSTGSLYWTVRQGGADFTGSATLITQSYSASGRFRATILIAGLTPGVGYTFKWGAYAVGGSVQMYAGTGVGAARIRVRAA